MLDAEHSVISQGGTGPMDTQVWWTRYKRYGDLEAREKLVVQYAPLVRHVLGRMALVLTGPLDADDMISYGIMGLLDAIERYDPERGVKFETYAMSRIRGSIVDALRSLDILSRGARTRARELQRTIARLEMELGRPPEDPEIAQAMGLEMPQFRELLEEAACAVVSLDSLLSGLDQDDRPAPRELSDSSSDLLADAEEEELVRDLARAIEGLPERERQLITLYYYEQLTMKEIAMVLGVSESRVCQLHARAVMLLRARLTAALDVAVVHR